MNEKAVSEPRNSVRRKNLAKALGLLVKAVGELPADPSGDRVAELLNNASDEIKADLESADAADEAAD